MPVESFRDEQLGGNYSTQLRLIVFNRQNGKKNETSLFLICKMEKNIVPASCKERAQKSSWHR